MADEAGKVVFVDLTEGRELVINRITSAGYFGSQHVITLGTNRMGVSASGDIEGQCAIVARLRFDNDMAKHLHSLLGDALALLTAPQNEKPN